eukprot:SAG22_NODE_8006_length_691_cov_1.400338_1_plen_141_part_01
MMSSSRRRRAPVGIVFDIDGVLLAGKSVIPGAAEALAKLRAAQVPHVFVTNGGGRSERRKAEQISELLGGSAVATGEQVCLAHSPMRELATRYWGQNVLILGCIDYASVASEYGFNPEKTFTVPELLAAKPELLSFFGPDA